MATFAEVKAVLDSLAVGIDPGRLEHAHGHSFRWETAACLRAAVADTALGTFPLIGVENIGNGRADLTYLVRILSGPIEDEGLPQMPLDGTVATAAQINTIRDWINAGALDDA